jgi:hypothetical protein
MAKLDALMEVQLGMEATDAWGTEVASTVKLMGVEDLVIQSAETSEIVDELRGTTQPGYRSFVHARHGEATMTGLVEIDDFPYLMAGLGGNTAGTTDAPGNFTYDWASPSEDTDTYNVKSYTLMKTDRTDTYSLLGATLNSLTVEGESGGPVTYSAEFVGKVVTTDVHAALSDRTTKPAMGHMGQLYIDVASDAVGATEIANAAYSFSWNVEANRVFMTHIGELNPANFRDGKWSGSLALSIEADTDTIPLYNGIIGATNATTGRNVRLKFSAATDSILTLDFSGVFLEAPELYSDEDGVVTLDFELQGQILPGGTETSFASAQVYSTVTTL